MTTYEFIESFTEDDLFDADKRMIMRICFENVAKIYFQDLFDEDLSDVASIVNANYYELAKEKLEGLRI